MGQTISTLMPPTEQVEDFDQALASIKELEERLGKLESENSKLKATKQGLMSDLRKKKAVDSFLKVAGIELTADTSEDEIAERIASLRAAPATTDSATPEPGTTPQPDQSSQQPPSDQPPVSSTPSPQPTPSDAMSAALEGKLASLEKQNKDLARLVQQITQERDEERARLRETTLEQRIIDELTKADCRRPKHLFKLEKENFDLLDDQDTVMYKVGEELMPLRDAIAKLKEDDEYSMYFSGSGASGSGLPPSRSSAPVASNNPFATGTVNATQAALMMTEKPEQARQLINQARAAGKLDPTMEKVFGGG